jgi:hypothetical protein
MPILCIACEMGEHDDFLADLAVLARAVSCECACHNKSGNEPKVLLLSAPDPAIIDS